jgi:RecA-family ATPase
MASDSAHDVRIALLARGFHPIPLSGKRPTLNNWTSKTDATAEEIAGWGPGNTGILTEYTPALDVDVTNGEAANAVADAVQEWFEGKGMVLPRYGRAPKFAIPMRTSVPFGKIMREFVDRHGEVHRLEVLCKGQQLAVAGKHPDTGTEYQWHGNYAPWTIGARDELPEVDEVGACALLDHLEKILLTDFGFERLSHAGKGDIEANGGLKRSDLPDDPFAILEHMTEGNRHNSQLSATAKLLCRGHSVEAAVDMVLDATRKLGEPVNGRDWASEKQSIERMCFDWISKHPEHSSALPNGLREKFEAERAEGYRAEVKLDRNRNWCIKVYGKPKKPKCLLELRPWTPIDEASLPPREWLYGKHYQRRTVSITAAPGGFGKSSLDMVEAIAMATGRNLLGEEPPCRLRVWLHNGDDSDKEMDRRVVAICKYYNIPQSELAGWLFTTTGNEFPLRVARGYNELQINEALLDAIHHQIAANSIDVATLDPLVTLHDVREQDNAAMDRVVRLFGEIADDLDCSFELVHHVRKGPKGSASEFDGYDMRGAGSVRDAVRSARVLNRMNEKEAEALAITDMERKFYFRLDRDKHNNAAPTEPEWFRFYGVILANGDDVGVVTQWTPPTGDERLKALASQSHKADEVFMTILHRFKIEGRRVNELKHHYYAPKVFAKESEAVGARITIKMLEDAMRRLFLAKRGFDALDPDQLVAK